LWKPQYIDAFNHELQTFSAEVGGMFAGHLHSQWQQIVSFDQGSEIQFLGVPAISPIFGGNQGFMVYTYTLPAMQLVKIKRYTTNAN
jgi:hypothetical protein